MRAAFKLAQRTMPIYQFHLSVPPDPEPLELKDDQDAWREAVVLFGEMLRDLDGKLDPGQRFEVIVEGETGRRVVELSLNATFHP
jgi:hypothetical protein